MDPVSLDTDPRARRAYDTLHVYRLQVRDPLAQASEKLRTCEPIRRICEHQKKQIDFAPHCPMVSPGATASTLACAAGRTSGATPR